MVTKTLLALLLVAAIAEARFSYEGYKVLSVPLNTRAKAKVVNQLEADGIDVWSAVIGKEANILVSPYDFSDVHNILVEAGMVPTVAISNVQELVDLEMEEIKEADAKRGRNSWIGNSYVRYSEIVAWLESLPSACGNKCAVAKIGKSYENRDIYAVRISSDVNTSGNKKALFFESNMHAREWLSHASVSLIVDTLIKGYGSNQRITRALDTFEWHFVVVSNPDGYEYTWTNDRYWRKNRAILANGCFGVDGNRNFDSHHCGPGASRILCYDTYCGPAPFSEPETQAIRDYATSLVGRLVVFNSIHTYSQMLLLPWSYAPNAYPPDFQEALRVAKAMTDAVYQNSRKVYEAGNTVDVLYEASGNSHDWAREKLNVTYSMTWELRPTPGLGLRGFAPPPSEIAPTASELLDALLTESEIIRY